MTQNKLRVAGFALLFLFPIISLGQKEITLERSVLGQYREFAPESLPMFQWIPNTDCYTYLKGYRVLVKSSVVSKTDTEWFTIDEVNKALGSQLTWFSGLKWKNENEFWVNDGANYYLFNTVTKTGKSLHAINGENGEFHDKTEHLAYTVENNVYVSVGGGKPNILTVTFNKNSNIVSGKAIARSEFGITKGLFWSNSGNFLAFYQKDETDVADYPLLDINATPGKLKNIKYPMAGQKSEKAKVGIFNLNLEKTLFITARSGEESYLTNVTFTPDDKYLLVAEVNRDQNHMWLQLYNALTGEFVRTLFEEQNDRWVEPEHPAFFPNTSSNNFIWISEKDGFNNLYYYDLTGKLISQLTANKFVTKEILEAKNGQIYFSATGDNPTNTLIYAVDLKGKQRQVTSMNGTHQFSQSTDGRYYYDAFSSHDIPNRAAIYSVKGKIVKQLVDAKNPYEGYTMGSSVISTITAKDGTTLYTRLIKPSNFDPSKKYPVLVYVYGGPHAQMITNSWLDGASLWMYWMAEQGYLIYTVDGRGSAERGFAFESQIHRQLGTVEIEDQLSGVDYLKSLPYVDGNRLAVHGWSFGGFMTTSLMLRTPDVFQVGVAGGPVTDWKYYEIMYGERYMDRPDENEKGYEKASLMTHAGNLKGDLLLIHGTVDDVVVMQHNLALVKKFIELGIQMDFFPYPMHEHNVYGKDRVHLMEKILTYIIENNK